MQHYMHIGLGFKANLLTDAIIEAIVADQYCLPELKQAGLWVVSYTEDYETKDWATVVVKDYGEMGDAGKFVYLTELLEKSDKLKLTKAEQVKVKELFDKYGISHLFEHIKPIVYSEMY